MRRPFELPARYHARLAARASAGDRAAFVSLYRELYPPVARFVARRVPSAADAEDVVARTFHRLLEGLAGIDGARGTVLAWTLAVARNAATDLARQRRLAGPPEGALEATDGRPDPLARLEADERLAALARLLAGLPAPDRELIEFRFGEGLRHAEIAALQGLTEAAVKQRVSRALRALRAALATPEPGRGPWEVES